MKKKILSVLASAMMTMSVAAVIPTEKMICYEYNDKLVNG